MASRYLDDLGTFIDLSDATVLDPQRPLGSSVKSSGYLSANGLVHEKSVENHGIVARRCPIEINVRNDERLLTSIHAKNSRYR